nr:MAG TPA: hypothetical protein [Caudoviricetes sp.]
MISKERHEIAQLLNMSDKTYTEFSKLADDMKIVRKNVGEELYWRFTYTYDDIEKTKYSVSMKNLRRVVTLPPEKQKQILQEFIENPKNMRKIWEAYLPQNIKTTIELDSDTNNKITELAKENGLSKTNFISMLLTEFTMDK